MDNYFFYNLDGNQIKLSDINLVTKIEVHKNRDGKWADFRTYAKGAVVAVSGTLEDVKTIRGSLLTALGVSEPNT